MRIKSFLLRNRTALGGSHSKVSNHNLVSNLIAAADMIRTTERRHTASMDKADVLEALTLLNNELKSEGMSITIKLFGSGVIILRYDDSRRISDDLDVLFDADSRVREAAERVAAKLDLPIDWFNDDVAFYNSPRLEFTTDGMPQFSNLKIQALTTESLFAMKMHKDDRPQGAADTAYLCKKLDIQSMEQAEEILHKYYPNRDMMTHPMMGIMSYLGLVEEQDLFNTEKFKKE